MHLQLGKLKTISENISIRNPYKKAQLKGDYIVYEEMREGKQILTLMNWKNGALKSLDISGDGYNFAHNGTYLALLENRKGQNGIRLIKIEDLQEIAFIPRENVFSFFLSKNHLIFTDSLDDGIYIMDIKSTNSKPTKLTEPNQSQFWPTVTDDRVIWANEFDGKYTGEVIEVKL